MLRETVEHRHTADNLWECRRFGEMIAMDPRYKERTQVIASSDARPLDEFLNWVTEERFNSYPSPYAGEEIRVSVENPLIKIGRAARFVGDLCSTMTASEFTDQEAANTLYLMFHLTDLDGRMADRRSRLRSMLDGEGERKDQLFNPAEILGVSDEKMAEVVNGHFSHLVTKHTALVAFPVGLVERVFEKLKEDGEFKQDYLHWVSAIVEMKKEGKLLFDTYLLDYALHRLYEMGRLEDFLRDPLLKYLYTPYSYSSFRWVLDEAFVECKKSREKFFDPAKIYTHAGIVREFKGRYGDRSEKLLRNITGKKPETAVVLGIGQSGFEAVDVKDALSNEVYGVDLLPFPKDYHLFPWKMTREKGFVAVDKILERPAWVNTMTMSRDIHYPYNHNRSRMSELLPEVAVMTQGEIDEFNKKRRYIKTFQSDLLGNLTECSAILGRCDVIYLRGVNCLHRGNSSVSLLRNALKFASPDGAYFVYHDITPAKGYPLCTDAIIRVDKTSAGRMKITPISLSFRPMQGFLPEEIFFTTESHVINSHTRPISEWLIMFWSGKPKIIL